MKRVKVREKSRVAGSMAVLLLAVMLTTVAVTENETVRGGATTNTGVQGGVPLSSVKGGGNGTVVSDYQGAYFYILPQLPNAQDSISEIYMATLNRSTVKSGTKGKTYRDYRDFFLEGEDSSNFEMWAQQYNIKKWQGFTTVPPQSEEALLVVPYVTWNGTSLKSGWKRDESAICYYVQDGAGVQDHYRLTKESKYLDKNIIFAPQVTSSSPENEWYRDGVFYSDLDKWTTAWKKAKATKDLNPNNEADAGKIMSAMYESLQDKLGNKTKLRTYMDSHSSKVNKGYTLWCYILQLDRSSSGDTFNASAKIDKFLQTGYNSNRVKRSDNLGLKGDNKMKKWDPEDGGYDPRKEFDEDSHATSYAQIEYNLHYLDLLMCGYAMAYEKKASSEVLNAWETAIVRYINCAPTEKKGRESNEGYYPDICICGGTIARGNNQDANTKKESNAVVYVGTQDLVNFSMLLENAAAETEESVRFSAKTNSRSMTKAFLGPKLKNVANGSKKYNEKGTDGWLMGMFTNSGHTKRYNAVNMEVFTYGTAGGYEGRAETTEVKNGKTGKTYYLKYVKSLPDYYKTYYGRMESAVRGGEAGAVKNMEATSATEFGTWHSNIVLRAVINTMYTRDKSGKVEKVTAKSDFRESIRLVRQVEGDMGGTAGAFKDRWGAMYVPAFQWPGGDSSSIEVSYGVVLTARSSLAAQAKKGETAETAASTHADMDFPEPQSVGKDRTTWQDNVTNKNFRKDFVITTRLLEDSDTQAEAFRKNVENVQLKLQVVYAGDDGDENKSAMKKLYSKADKEKLKVRITIIPLTNDTIAVSKGADGEISTRASWNTSYTSEKKKVTCLVGDENTGTGKSYRFLQDKGDVVSKEVFKSLFLPEGDTGEVIILDVDRKFFTDTGFDVAASENGEKKEYIGYQAVIEVSMVDENGGSIRGFADAPQTSVKVPKSNKVALGYGRTKTPPPGGEYSGSYNYTSRPEAYAELKEGTVLNEQFEAMAGVPSTRSLYFSTGGSEFIVNLRCSYEANQKAERTYRSHFNGNDCEFRKTDALKQQSSGNTITETFVADAQGRTVSSSVACQENRAVEPQGAGSKNTTVSEHGSATEFYAEWTGSIGNNTSEPADIGSFDAGHAGSPCAGKGFDVGKLRTKAEPATNWDVSAYNTALAQAVSWASAMEGMEYTVSRVADSDGQTRRYRVGKASITITLTGGSNSHSHTTQRSYGGGTYNSASAASQTLNSDDKGKLGSGWGWTDGQIGSGSGYVNGTGNKAGHGASCSGHGTDSKGNPKPCTCVDHACGSFTPARDLTQGASAGISYRIRVSFPDGKTFGGPGNTLSGSEKSVGSRLPAHALCGPCCQHELPAVEDRWTQTVYFDTMAITDMQVWKLESGYVKGMSEILEGNAFYSQYAAEIARSSDDYDAGTSAGASGDDGDLEDWEKAFYEAGGGSDSLVMSDRVYAGITQADPNIYYNIAARNVENGRGEYNTSRAGRLRYSLQTGQDDTVYYEEKNAKGELKRSNKCDGTKATLSASNPVPSGGKGHREQPWASGCLYSNPVYVNGADYHRTATDDLKTGYNATTLASKKTDAVDMNTEEWKRFDRRRNQQVQVTVISDFLILQTSSGDQSVLYHEAKSRTVRAQENYGEVNVDPDESNAAGYQRMVSGNGLHMKQGTAINVGSYNGRYYDTTGKYAGTGNRMTIPTAFDNDAQKYNSITDELGLADVTAGHAVGNSANANMSCAAYEQRLPRVNGLLLVKNNLIQCPTNANGEYVTGQSYAFYRPLIRWSDGGKRYTSTTRQADWDRQRDLRENPPAEPVYTGYTKLAYTRLAYASAGYQGNKSSLLETEIARTGAVSPEDEEDVRYLRDMGKESCGILLNSIYALGKTKCNDIVVHDPVSTQYCRIMRTAGQGSDLDQRTAASYADAAGAGLLNMEMADEGGCPGIPGECNFRVLNCRYGQNIVRAAFPVDRYAKTYTGDEENGESADESDYAYSIFSTVPNSNGGTPGISLAGSGFVIRSAAGEIPPVPDGEDTTDYVLMSSGNASLAFNFSKLGVESSNTSERARIEANFRLDKKGQKMPLVSTDHLQLFVEADGYLTVSTDDGAAYRSTVRIFSMVPTAGISSPDSGTHRIGISLSFGSISDFSVTSDGTDVSFTRTREAEGVYEESVCGPDFYLGNRAGGAKYETVLTVDNIQLTRLAGTTEHTDACYIRNPVHESTIQNTYNGLNGDGEVDWLGTKDDGSLRATTEYNAHTHTASCLTAASEGYLLAFDRGKDDCTILERMVGPTLWAMIVRDFNLEKNEDGKYTLAGSGDSGDLKTGDVRNFGYTGSVQSVRLDAGTYVLETWGAQGGSSSGGSGKTGGYVRGKITLTEATTLYVVVGGKGGDKTGSIDQYNSYNYNGGYNGGGSGTGSAGPGGGGATHIATTSAVLSSNGGSTSSINGLIMIACGGGASASGAGTYGNSSYMNGANGYTGYSGSYPYDTGGGGAGYRGGASVSGDDPKYGYSGTSYAAGNLTEMTVTHASSESTGNGRARITAVSVSGVGRDELFSYIYARRGLMPDTVTTNGKTIVNPVWDCRCAYDRHECTQGCRTLVELKCNEPHHFGKHYDYSSQICYDACMTDANHRQYQTEVTDHRGEVIRADDFILLDNYFDVYFPNTGNFYNTDDFGIPDTQYNRGRGYTNDMDTTEWTREKWIKFPYGVLYERNGVWEEHISGEWFQLEVFDSDGNTLDTYHFYCLLKNDELGSGEVQYAVEAVNHETTPGEVEKMTTTAYYHERHVSAAWPYIRDGQLYAACPADGGSSLNATRYDWLNERRYGAYQDSWNHSFIDVIGRIGNLIVEDTDDLRFSNFFKKTNDRGWLIDGVLKTVDQDRQNCYLSWWRNNGDTAIDIRGLKAGEANEWYNTYGTQRWTAEATAVSGPLSASRNNVPALRNSENELRLGYNVLWDVSSIGNYENGTLQVIPYYYALNIRTGTLTPVDVYADSGDRVEPIHFAGLMDSYADGSGNTAPGADFDTLRDRLYAYNMTLNWVQESARRNYRDEEQDITEALSQDTRYGAFAYDGDGNAVMKPVMAYNEETGTWHSEETQLVYNLTIPYGDSEFVLGNSQLIWIDCRPSSNGYDGGRARTFIGSSRVTALHNDINGSNNTNLLGLPDGDYWVRGQRWHLTLGLPSSAEFVAYHGGEHVDPNSLITLPDGREIYARDEFKADARGACDYVILMTADIKVLGDVYNLQYDQGFDNGVFRASNGNVFRFGNDIPTVIGIYGIGSTTTPDIDIMQTH